MTDTTDDPDTPDPIGPDPSGPEPRLRDLVRVRFVLEEHQDHPGIVIDVLHRPAVPRGNRYRVRFRDGVTGWHGRDELAVVPFPQREIVRSDLGAIRIILDHATAITEKHDLLHRALGDMFDAVTVITNTYLGGFDAPTSTD